MNHKKWLSIVFLFVTIGLATPMVQSADYDAEQEAAERIKRQLELANEMREKRLKKQREKQQQLQKEERLQKRCAKLKDELRRLGERRRWYKLDEKGERVYLTEAEVKRNKEYVRKEYDSQCDDYR